MFAHRLTAALAGAAALLLLIAVSAVATEPTPTQDRTSQTSYKSAPIAPDVEPLAQPKPVPRVALRPSPADDFIGAAHPPTPPVAEDTVIKPAPIEDAPPVGSDWQSETDPFRRCAMKALAGEYGPLEDWQRDAYIWGLETGVTCSGVAKVTSYGPWEPCGTVVASGGRVHLRGCAANPEIPFGTLIWTPYGLRYVIDRGGWVKVGYARVFGRYKRVTSSREIANIDYYTMREWKTLRNAPFAVVKQTGDRTVWWMPHNRRGG